jgi:hypothetical protein
MLPREFVSRDFFLVENFNYFSCYPFRASSTRRALLPFDGCRLSSQSIYEKGGVLKIPDSGFRVGERRDKEQAGMGPPSRSVFCFQ